MKKLRFTYQTVYTFDQPIYNHHYTLKIYPRNSQRQKVLALTETMDFGDCHSYSVDSFGNKSVYGRIEAPHKDFAFQISGQVVVDGASKDTDTHLLSLFRMPSVMTRSSAILRDAIEEVTKEAEIHSCFHTELRLMTDIQKATYLSDYCYSLLEYTPNATDIHTDASHALKLGKGVCQDYAHILIALLRLIHIPARYVVGFMMGEGYTHAWVEAFCDGQWIGLDPTNCRLVDETYIKLSHGRDYLDTIVCKGHFYGIANQEQDILVQVEEEDYYDK